MLLDSEMLSDKAKAGWAAARILFDLVLLAGIGFMTYVSNGVNNELRLLREEDVKLRAENNATRADLAAVRIELPTFYARKEDVTAAMTRVENSLRRIEDKIDMKADKAFR